MDDDEWARQQVEWEKEVLKRELREGKRREQINARATRFALFLAIWWGPLFGMQMVGGEWEPLVGPLTVSGAWFLAIPLGFWIYCRLTRSDDDES